MLANPIKIGISAAQSPDEQREYFYSNILYLALFTIIAIAFIYNLLGIVFTSWEERVDVWIYILIDVVLLSVAGLGLYLNSINRYWVSRALITIAVPLLLFGLAPFLIQTVDIYFWFPYAPTGFMLFAHFLYVKQKYERYVLLFSAIFFLITLFSTDVLNLIIQNPEVDEFRVWLDDYPVVFRRSPITTFVFVFISVHFTIKKSRAFERQILQQNQLLEEANNSKDKFHSIIAHDLRGPFNSLVGLTKVLKSNIDELSKEEIAKSAEILYSSSKNTHRLLENLLEWSQIQTGSLEFKPQKVSLSGTISETLESMESMAGAKSIGMTYDCHLEDIEITADSRMLQTIIRNLLTNAIKFTPTKGHITLRCSETDNHLKVEVQDNGVGMTEDQVEGLFKQQHKASTLGTNKERGSGLGLMLVNEFVKLHHGTIDVRSAIGLGTSISFTVSKELQVNGAKG